MTYIVLVKLSSGELSYFDEAALETALRLREISGGEVWVLTMSPERAADRLTALTRIGVDRAILLSDRLYAGSDTAATSYILSCAICRLLEARAEDIASRDDLVILCGRQSMDGDTAQVGPSVAARLGIPVIANAMSVEMTECDSAAGYTDIVCDTRTGRKQSALPALVTVERICRLRFPRMRSKTREIERYDNSYVEADPDRCGQSGSLTKVVETFESERGRRSCVFLTPEQLLIKLKELIAEEPVSNRCVAQSTVPLDELWAVGKATAEAVRGLAKRVRIIERLEVGEYVKLIKNEQPTAVIFPADLWGRCVAPQVASLVEAGLCADCIRLETDGERLYMYRPAFGGNITAKIICRTRPQMATLRLPSESGDIVVSAGLGVRGELDKLRAFAGSLGAQLGASRGLVDAGVMPYESQVGVTGRCISPKIYIAVGISGAVQHMAAVEGARYIVGINPDRGARLYDYCDYGCTVPFEEIADIYYKY